MIGSTKGSLVVPTQPPYINVIAALPPDIPACFRYQAQRAAAYLQFLDGGDSRSFGSSFEKEAQTFGDRLMETGFVLSQLAYNRTTGQGDAVIWITSGEKSYPPWVHQRRRPMVFLGPGEEGKVSDYYLRYCQGLGRPEETGNGTYYHFDERAGIPMPRDSGSFGFHKGYIENTQLLNDRAVVESLCRLSRERLHPFQMKLSEHDKLVMYWPCLSDVEIAAMVEVFCAHGIQIRGPARDPLLIFREGEDWKIKASASHDASLGAGGYNITWREPLYDPEKFLRQWLAATFVYGKRPDDPYQLSFVKVELPPDEDLNEARQALTGPALGVSLVFLPERGYLGLWHEQHEWRL